MKLPILDRYIIRKYVFSFVFTAFLFTIIGVAINFSENVDKYSEAELSWGEIGSYYGDFIIWLNGLLFPIFAMISVIFFTSRMAYNSEIISVFNAGISFRRFLRPYLIVSLGLMAVYMIGGQWLIPTINKDKIIFERTYILKHTDKASTNDVHMFIAPNTKIYVRSYSKRDSVAHDLRLEKFDSLGRLQSYIKTPRAEWKSRDQSWEFSNYETHEFQGLEERVELHANEKLDTVLNLFPADFSFYENEKDLLTFSELEHYITRERARGAGTTEIYLAERHRRFADPFTLIILTIIGVSLAARKVRGGIGLHLAIGMVLGALYIFLSKFAITFAASDTLPVVLAMWLPNILFGIVAWWLVGRAQK